MAFTDNQTGGRIKYGGDPAPIVLAGTVSRGDCLGYSGGWVRALATVGTAIQMRCVAGEDGVDNQQITAYFGTILLEGDRITGATPGGAVYVAEGTSNGQYTQTAPSTSGDVNKIVGYAISATELALTPNRLTDSVA